MLKNLFKINLQLFAEEETSLINNEQNEEAEPEDAQDEDEDEEGEDDVEDSAEQTLTVGKEGSDENVDSVKFDVKQQSKIDEIVRTRLERQERAFHKEIEQVAGTSFEKGEVHNAANLWGFLKLNPEISNAVQQIIDAHIAQGRYTQPHRESTQSNTLAVKEAIIDLRESDKTFNKNYKVVMDWADDQGIDIVDAKSLKTAYLAWQGANGSIIKANEQLAKKRQEQKQSQKTRASVMSGNKGSRKGSPNYSKMSARDILAAEGLSLFTED